MSIDGAHRLTEASPRRSSDWLDTHAMAEARLDLTACLREAARLGLHEGICNHFSAMVPGRDDVFLVNPYGLAFAEVTPSRLLVCDLDGAVLAGDGIPEPTAFFIHARLHRRVPRARVALHTHMPHSTALALLDGPPLAWASQQALKFHGRLIVDEHYNGLALDTDEGDRIAASLVSSSAEIVFLRSHGVLVTGATIAAAWDDLYYLERACEVQRLAEATGRRLVPIPSDIAERTARQMRATGEEPARLHLDSVQRRLDRDEPGWRH